MPYLSHKLNTAAIEGAVKLHGTVFFTDDLQPVQPQPGQWFCEYHVDTLFGGLDVMHDGALVQYIAEVESITLDHTGAIPGGMRTRTFHQVAETGSDVYREPRGDILVLQP